MSSTSITDKYTDNNKLIYSNNLLFIYKHSNVNIQMMSNFYRVNNASFVMLMSDNVEQMLEYPVPGAKGKFQPGSII